MTINLSKCYVVRFSRRERVIFFPYSLMGSALPAVDTICDLEVHFNSHFDFNEHINHICNSARKTLGFLKRFAIPFRNPLTLKVLYFSLVRAQLEYASQIWFASTVSLKYMVEKVQYTFL